MLLTDCPTCSTLLSSRLNKWAVVILSNLVIYLQIHQPSCANAASLPWQSSHKLVTSGGAGGDRTGRSVAIRDQLALVGAPNHDNLGSNAGAAYLFNPATGNQIHKLEAIDQPPFDAYVGDEFGFAVALNGNRAIVSAPQDDEYGSNSGAIYAFDLDPITGIPTGSPQKLTATGITGGEQLGYSVAVSGSTAVVGALTASGNLGAAGVGAAYVYQHDGSTWSFDKKLTINDPSSALDGDMHGWSVDLDGTTAIIGGRDGSMNSGTAYLFDTATGTQLAKLSATDNGETGLMDPFNGSSVAIDNDYAVVGSTAGEAVYVFEKNGLGTWSYLHKLTADDAALDDLFGFSIGLDGQTAIVGAPAEAENGLFAGSAYLFDVTTGNQIDKLTAFDGAQFDSFGFSVAIDDDTAIAGSILNFTSGGFDTGSAYLFEATQEADFNEDGFVNGSDLTNWMGGFGMLGPNHTDGDADQDDDVDGLDFLTWQRQFEILPPTALSATVPEPSSLALVLMAAIVCWASQRPRERA